jgi:pimeloyl-ACP methyl ester carboxylesterase
VTARDATRRAMQRLLDLGGVRAESHERRTTWRHHWLEAGAGGGRPLVLIQGAGGGAANWYRLFEMLGRDRRLLAPELPGFGLSDPVNPQPPLGVQGADLMLDWLEAVLPGTAVDLLSTSFGGLVALRMAQRRPERIARLVLLNAAGLGRELAVAARLAAHPALHGLLERPSRAGTRVLLRALLTSVRLPADHEDALVEYMVAAAAGGAGAVLAAALGHFADLGGQREILSDDELRGLVPPVLIVWGGRDRFLAPSHGVRAAALIPDARRVVLDEVGHSPNWEAPDDVLSAVRAFLE